PIYTEPISGPSSAGVPIFAVPILALSGHSDGASEVKLACASEQEVWPSAASGLMVRSGGSWTVTLFSCDGDGVNPSVCGTLKLRSNPEAESVSWVVRFELSTGLKVSFSQPVTGGYSDAACAMLTESW